MDKNLEKDAIQSPSLKLPVFRKYISNSDQDALRETVAFLSRLNKTNDLITKTLLSPSVTKDNEYKYYSTLIQTGYKHFLSYKKRKVTPANLQKILSWLESIETLSESLYKSKNYKELWSVSGNALSITFDWLPYETCFEPDLIEHLEKICAWIEIVYQETPAVNLKVEMISTLNDLIYNLHIPVFSSNRHPLLFLFEFAKYDDSMNMDYFKNRRNYRNIIRQEFINIDNVEFSINIRSYDQKFAVETFLEGYNIYENAKTAYDYILNESKTNSIPSLLNQFMTTSLKPSFIDELVDKSYKLKKISGGELVEIKMKLFLLSGEKKYLQQAQEAGLDYETISINMEKLEIPCDDIRKLYTLVIFNKIEDFSEWIKDENHFSLTLNNLVSLEPKRELLEIIIVETYEYLDMHLGPISHQLLEKLSNYLKNNGYGNHAKSMKQNLKKLFPERKYLLNSL